MNILKGLLGGHANKAHIDEGALNYIINTYNINSMVDIGCGLGYMSEIGIQKKLRVLSIDGDKKIINNNINLIYHDFRLAPLCINYFDLGWCIEFLEHIPEENLNNVTAVFLKCKYILITHAIPPDKNRFHINVQYEQYWIDFFKMLNFIYLERETNILKQSSSMKRNFIRNTGKLFFNEGLGDKKKQKKEI